MWDNEYGCGESFPNRWHLINVDKKRFFFQHYGLTERDLERYLAAAPSAGSFGHGAGPSTSFTSNLMTSTGHPSAATITDGVNGSR